MFRVNLFQLMTIWQCVLIFLLCILPASTLQASSPGASVADNARPCWEDYDAFFYLIRRGSIGLESLGTHDGIDPNVPRDGETRPSAVTLFRSLFGDEAYGNSSQPHSFHNLENDILDHFAVAPELRDVQSFRQKWHLSERQYQDLLTYYGTRVFHDDPRAVGEINEVFERLRELSRIHFLAQPQNLRRFRYYRSKLTQLSVPEMARGLGISEGQVYHELSQFQLSIVEAFERQPNNSQFSQFERELTAMGRSSLISKLDRNRHLLGNARILHQEGLSTGEIARVLGVGRSALEFIFHHTGVQSRATSWERLLTLDGVSQPEVFVLVALHTRGLSHQEIADRLNQLAGTTSPTHPNLRTQRSVSQMLHSLGLSQPNNRGRNEVYDPHYGYLKRSGQLVPTAVIRFLFEHYQKSDEWLSEQLAVNVTSLLQFYQRHHIVRLDNRQFQVSRPDSDETARRLNQYQRQRVEVDLVLDWIEANGRQPLTEDWGMGAGKIGVTRATFFGQVPSSHLRTFDNVEDALFALRERAQERGVSFSLLKVKFSDSHSERFRSALQQEAIERILELLRAENGRFPGTMTLSSFVDRSRLMGVGSYAAGRSSRGRHIFSDRNEFLLAVYRAAREQEVPLRVTTIQARRNLDRPGWLRAAQQEEVIESFVNWIRVNGRYPNLADDGDLTNSEGELPFGRRGLFGGPSSPGVFSSPSSLFENVWRRAEREGVSFDPMGVPIWNPSQSLIEKKQSYVLDKSLEWALRNGNRVPSFSTLSNAAGVSDRTLSRLFLQPESGVPSQESFLQGLRARARERGIELVEQ